MRRAGTAHGEYGPYGVILLLGIEVLRVRPDSFCNEVGWEVSLLEPSRSGVEYSSMAVGMLASRLGIHHETRRGLS